MPTLPHEAIVADVVYLVILLTHSHSLSLLSAMVGYLKSGLRVLCESFCNVVVEEDEDDNVVVGPDGESKVKTPNPYVDYPTHTSWHGMSCTVHL